MRTVFLLFLLLFSPVAALAQVPGITPEPAAAGATTDADLNELIRIIENEQTRAALIERLKRADAEADVPADAPPDLSIVRQLAEYTRAAAEGTSATLRSL
ncbi:MAG TPA: hypothetical protein VK165_00730, partial [Azonexus sp.]|nr:hypothetical protein [Azonexus sp.]